MPFRFLEDIATADIAFEATGKSLEEAFENAGKATFSVITNIDSIENVVTREIKIESEDVKSLLFDWIDEILFYWDSERLVFAFFDIVIQKTAKGYLLHAKVHGEELDSKRHELRQNVKSPTYHMMKTENKGGEWSLRMVLDL